MYLISDLAKKGESLSERCNDSELLVLYRL
jgi:hypothetical protein